MIQRTSTIPPTVGRSAVALGSAVRYAAQVARHVQRCSPREVEFAEPRLVSDGSSRRAWEIDVANVGERAYRPTLWVEIYDADGALRAKIEQTRGLLVPGGTLRQRFDLRGLASGAYKALVFADTGEDSIFAAQYAVEV